MKPITRFSAYSELTLTSQLMKEPSFHLRELWKDEKRQDRFLWTGAGICLDAARQRIDEIVLDQLLKLALECGVIEKFADMANGEIVNKTEGRPALHMASRMPKDQSLFVNGVDVAKEFADTRNQIARFAEEVHTGKMVGSTKKKFQHVVVVGIGGSYLGAAFLYEALLDRAISGIRVHFLPNVDPYNYVRIRQKIDLETTLWVFVSKSFTTTESLFNIRQAIADMGKTGLTPGDHIVTVSSKKEDPNVPPIPQRERFLFHDGIGGRFSATSAVGILPLALGLGLDVCDELIQGAHEMDVHALTAPTEENLPLLGALVNVWNNCFFSYEACAVIPYAEALGLFPLHLQQLSMESCGKRVNEDGELLQTPSGMILFGTPGTGAQHSFFQMAHQGRSFPIDFIGVKNPIVPERSIEMNGVTAGQTLFSNLLAQANALAFGKKDTNPQTEFDGNRPSTIITISDLSPRNMGRLLSYYEAKTVMEAFVLGINPFDQFGVELGKKMAGSIYQIFADINKEPNSKAIIENSPMDVRRYL